MLGYKKIMLSHTGKDLRSSFNCALWEGNPPKMKEREPERILEDTLLGVHSLKDPSEARIYTGSYGSVVVLISHYGKIIEGERGYRSEEAVIVAIYPLYICYFCCAVIKNNRGMYRKYIDFTWQVCEDCASIRKMTPYDSSVKQEFVSLEEVAARRNISVLDERMFNNEEKISC